MLDLTLLPSAIEGIKRAADIAVGMANIKTATEINAKAIELQTIILQLQGNTVSAYMEQQKLLREIEDLKGQLAQIADTAQDLKRYRLCNPLTNVTVCGLLKAECNGEPPHYLCSQCFTNKRKSILNQQRINGFISLACPSCRASIDTGYRGFAPKYVEDIEPT